MGWPSVAWGLAHISSHEIAEWLAYGSIEPFGDVRGDLQAGIVAATIANANRDSDKKRDAFEATDFMPDFEQAEKKQEGMSGADTLALMRLWFPPVEGVNENAT